MRPSRRRACIDHVRDQFKDSTVGMTLGADGSFIKFERKLEDRGSDKKLVGDEVKLRI